MQYPEVQLTAQEELDRVVGKSRLPTLEDRSLLPYVTALSKEVLRYARRMPSQNCGNADVGFTTPQVAPCRSSWSVTYYIHRLAILKENPKQV